MPTSDQLESITLGGGCFWCVEAVYSEMNGVESAVSGYMGGHVENPTYAQVCSKNSGHIEVVQVTFDPAVAPLADILRVFFVTHDPTTKDRQGNDVGPQYRSAIFYADETQKQVAEQVMAEISAEKIYDQPIVTELYPIATFYKAEDNHQDYFANNGYQPYCMFVIAPKVAKFRKKFADKLKQPVS